MRTLSLCVATVLFPLATASSGGTAVSEPPEIVISHPAPDTPVFGEVVFTVEVAEGGTLLRVDFFFQGEKVGSDETPPFEITLDAGAANVEKRFTAVAFWTSGGESRVTRNAPPVPIDLELDLPLRQLYVTVTRDDSAILDLERQDFRIFDSDVEQQLVTFERGDVPMTLVLLVDASASMAGERIASAVEASRELLRRLHPLDEAMLLIFSDRVRHITRFRQGVQKDLSIDALEAAGGTAINDHLYAALRLLDGRQGRPVVVLLSDGADTLSFLSIDQVVWKLRRSDALIYRLRPSRAGAEQIAFATSWRDYPENHDEVAGLETAIRETGGRIHSVPFERLGEGIANVLQELREQYVLGYYPALRTRDGAWRPVRVEVDRPGVKVRARSGYLDH